MAAPGHDPHAEAHAHDDFDPEPARELSPGEPTSPAWLPLLGAGLFLVGGIYFFASRADSGPAGAASASASVAAAPAPPRPPRTAPTARSTAREAPHAPEDRAKLNQMLREKVGDDLRNRPRSPQ